MMPFMQMAQFPAEDKFIFLNNLFIRNIPIILTFQKEVKPTALYLLSGLRQSTIFLSDLASQLEK